MRIVFVASAGARSDRCGSVAVTVTVARAAAVVVVVVVVVAVVVVVKPYAFPIIRSS